MKSDNTYDDEAISKAKKATESYIINNYEKIWFFVKCGGENNSPPSLFI